MVSIANGAANGPLSGTFAADKSQTLSSQYHKKNLELGCEQTSRGANGFVRDSGVDNKTGLIAKNGYVRHFIAILALSAIVMANMNRQAYNQALVRMIKKPPSSTTTTTKIQEPAARIETEPDVHVTNDTSPPPPDLTNSPPLTVPSEESLMPMFSEPIDSIVDQEVATGDPNSNTNQTQAGPQDSPQQSSTNEKEEEDGFDWTGAQIGTLQAGFSLGYTFFMIPGGRLSEIYGSKWVIFVSGFGSALCSILTPFIASQSYALLVASRVFMGLCQTGVSPALYAFCTRWLAPDESSVYLPMIKVGVMIGFMLGSLINGFLPWRLMFYVVGIAGFLWSLLWACFATSEPREQRYITKSELAYIEQALEQRRAKESPNSVKSSSAPWWNLMTNSVVLAFTFTKFTVKMSTDAQTMQLPMYMRNVFQVSDSLNGILNGANFAIQACFTGLVAYVAKEMVARKAFKLNKTGVRCLFQGINNFGMGLGYLLISFNMGSLELVCCAVMILSISSMFGSGGEAVLPVDLTTEYAASIMAIANSMANLSGIILPKVVALLLGNQLTSTERWNHVLWFLSSTLICGGLVFCFFVKAKVQDFSVGNRTRREASEKKVNKPLNPQIVVDLEPASQTTRL